MIELILLGAGQLGSRHLQALSRIQYNTKVYVVDQSKDSLIRAEERFNEMPFNPMISSVDYYENLDEVKGNPLIAINATGSEGRAEILMRLVTKFEVEALIIEKFLFQSLKEYDKINKFLASTGVLAWVNCPRRMFPGYIWLKSRIGRAKIFSLLVSGGNWGLASNSIHFIDLAFFLGVEPHLEYSTNAIDSEVIESKRRGYIEITGTLEAISISGTRIVLTSYKESTIPLTIIIETDFERYIIDEAQHKVLIFNADSGSFIEEFEIRQQSELTHLAVEQFISSKSMPLTPFSESSSLHFGLLQALIKEEKIFNNSFKEQTLPIT